MIMVVGSACRATVVISERVGPERKKLGTALSAKAGLCGCGSAA